MSFTFSETLATDLDYVRFRLDDVEPDDPRLSNELITALLTNYGLEGALLEGCNRIRLFYGKEPDRVGLAGGKSFSWKDRYYAYDRLYQELMTELKSSGSSGILVGSLPFDQDAIDHYLPLHDLPCPSR